MRQGSGGSVAAALALVSSRVNARLKAARELKVEVAGTRLAKWFVAGAMPAIFLIMYAMNADFARFYTTEPLGWAVLGAAAVLVLLLALCLRTLQTGLRCPDALGCNICVGIFAALFLLKSASREMLTTRNFEIFMLPSELKTIGITAQRFSCPSRNDGERISCDGCPKKANCCQYSAL